MNPREGMARAVEMLGSTYKLADAIGFSQTSVWLAVKNGLPSPVMAANIEVATQGAVKREHLRPDVFATGDIIKNSIAPGRGRKRRREGSQ